MHLVLKSAQIVHFCGKLSGFIDFENTVDRGSHVNFDADSRLCGFRKKKARIGADLQTPFQA